MYSFLSIQLNLIKTAKSQAQILYVKNTTINTRHTHTPPHTPERIKIRNPNYTAYLSVSISSFKILLSPISLNCCVHADSESDYVYVVKTISFDSWQVRAAKDDDFYHILASGQLIFGNIVNSVCALVSKVLCYIILLILGNYINDDGRLLNCRFRWYGLM